MHICSHCVFGSKIAVVFQHIPFFNKDPWEDTSYCNIPKEKRLVYLEKLYKAGVRHIFCGHYHKNDGGRYKDMTQIVTAALGAPFGEDPSGYRIVHVGKFDITHEYKKLRETTSCEEFDEAKNKVVNKDDQDKNEKQEGSQLNNNNKLQGKWLWACCGAKAKTADVDTDSHSVGPEVEDEREH